MKKATPISTNELRNIAYRFRNEYELKDNLVFPVMEILDALMDKELLDYIVIENDDAMFEQDTLAYYDIKDNIIYIKETVYLEALDNIGRSIFTLTHELAHYILFKVMNFEVEDTIEGVVTYCDPEWQANMLAGELLVPYYETIDMMPDEIVKNCHVSEECALVTYQKRHKKKTYIS